MYDCTRFTFHVTGQRPAVRSIDDEGAREKICGVKICATYRVQFSVQLFGTGFRANRHDVTPRGRTWPRQRLSNGQNDYLQARLGAISLFCAIRSAIDICDDRGENPSRFCCCFQAARMKLVRSSGTWTRAHLSLLCPSSRIRSLFGTDRTHVVLIKLAYTTCPTVNNAAPDSPDSRILSMVLYRYFLKYYISCRWEYSFNLL